MLTQSDREVFHRILDYLGVKLELRSITGGAPKQNASSNSLYFYTKSTNTLLFEKIKDYDDDVSNWKLTSEGDAAKFLLENLVEFLNISFSKDKACQMYMGTIKNPFLGCSNLEEAALKLDILTGGDGVVEDDGRELE